MTSNHARTRPRPSVSVALVTIAATAAALVRAFAPASGTTTVLALVALAGAGALGAIIWRPRRPFVVGHLAAGAIAILAVLLMGGVVLVAIQIDIGTRSTSIYLAAVSLLLGGTAIERRRHAAAPAFAHGEVDLPADTADAAVQSGLDAVLGRQIPDLPLAGRNRTVSRVATASAVVILAVSAVVLSYLSADDLAKRESFIALSTTTSKGNATGRDLTIEVANRGESYSQYRLDISEGATNRQINLTVGEDTARTLRIRVPVKAIVTVKLFRSDRPESAYRQTRSLPPAA